MTAPAPVTWYHPLSDAKPFICCPRCLGNPKLCRCPHPASKAARR